MKTLVHFDRYKGEWLRAVQQDETTATRFRQWLAGLPGQLYEVWLLPENEPTFSGSRFLADDLNELLRFYQIERSPVPLHAAGRQHALVALFAENLQPRDTRFNFSVQESPCGQVISVVFGTRRAMTVACRQGLRAE